MGRAGASRPALAHKNRSHPIEGTARAVRLYLRFNKAATMLKCDRCCPFQVPLSAYSKTDLAPGTSQICYQATSF